MSPTGATVSAPIRSAKGCASSEVTVKAADVAAGSSRSVVVSSAIPRPRSLAPDSSQAPSAPTQYWPSVSPSWAIAPDSCRKYHLPPTWRQPVAMAPDPSK